MPGYCSTISSFLILCFAFQLLSIYNAETAAAAKQRRISKLNEMQISKRSRVPRQNGNGETAGEEDTVPPGPEKKISQRIKFLPFKMPPGYNKFQIPNFGYLLAIAGPDVVSSDFFSSMPEILSHPIEVMLRVQDVGDVNEMDEDITFSADLVLSWADYVINQDGHERYNLSTSSEEYGPEDTDPLFKTVDQEILHEIWKPDIFIESLVKVTHPEIMTKPVTVRINEITGAIIYSARLRIQMECEMDFYYYPADTQKCLVVLRSHSYSVDEITLGWSEPSVVLEDCGGSNFDFRLEGVEEKQLVEEYIRNTTRKFSGLQFYIVARRRLSYHMVQTYLPSVFFIIITWLCFLVPSTMVEARIGIAMTTLLTLTAMFASVRESSPTVSYVRAIDIWMVACIFFVFLTLLEFSVLLWLRSTGDEKPSASEEDEKKRNGGDHDGSGDVSNVEFKPVQLDIVSNEGVRNKKAAAALFIELYAFRMFSILFLIFNSIYWGWLLIGSEYFGWDVDPDFNNC